MDKKKKQVYQKPKLTKYGSVADLTKTGLTNPGADGKIGSAPSHGR